MTGGEEKKNIYRTIVKATGLFGGRNNIIYRISRIEELAGLDLEQHGIRLGLEISFLMLELYGMDES